MVKLLNVTYRYTKNSGVENISFDVGIGEFVLLVGKTGAGKTTLFKLISLELAPQSGEIRLERYRTREIKPRHYPLWRRRLGIIFQDMCLLNDRSTLENVRLGAICGKNISGTPQKRALQVLGRVGMSHKIHQNAGELSAGEQQRTAIARALVNAPFLILADEPVSHLDSGTAREVIDLLSQVNAGGTALLVATHQPERFEGAATRIIVLDKGHLDLS